MNWKALLQTLTVSLVGVGFNWVGTAVLPLAGPWSALVAAGLSVAAAYAAKSPWTAPPAPPAPKS